jgi:SagB-type dehydrogenase family enzyme
MRKYGDRGYRYILIEAGHVGQNAMLSCENLELASLALGGFLDAPLADLLGIDAGDELPIYAIAVGRR